MNSPETCVPDAGMLPAGFADRMRRLLGEEYPAFLASYGKPRRPALRVNPLRLDGANRVSGGNADSIPGSAPDGDSDRVRALLPFLAERVPFAADGWYYPDDPALRPGRHPYHEAGLYYIQEASAMIPAALCPPRPGERVLDLCAAPGGKATQLAAALRGQGLLVANEIHPGRAAVLSGNIERMGIPNALVLNMEPQALAERFPGFFDRIVVDAPCSGEGMFRKEPQAAQMWSPDNIALCAARQADILRAAARMLAPGGTITYSTCTFAPEEDEGSVVTFLREHPDFDTVMPESPAVLACLADGLLDTGRPDWVPGGEAYVGSLRRAVRLFPHHADGEGHFAVLLRRRSGTDAVPVPAAPRRPERAARRNARPGRGSALPDAVRLFGQFAADVLGCVPEGVPCLFGDTLSLLPAGCGLTAEGLDGLRVLRAGLELGSVAGGRFTPAHALAMAALPLPPGAHRYALDAAGNQPAAYLRGETLPCPQALSGWYTVTLDGFPLGWGKADRGILKNHYPKGLRKG